MSHTFPLAYEGTETEKVERHDPEFFSRASHFAIILIPALVGQLAVFAMDYLSRVPHGVQYLTPLKEHLAMDASLWFHGFAVALFIFGLGAGIYFLHALNRFEDWERGSRTES